MKPKKKLKQPPQKNPFELEIEGMTEFEAHLFVEELCGFGESEEDVEKKKALCPKCNGRIYRWENLSYTSFQCLSEDGEVIDKETMVPYSELKSYGEAGLKCPKCGWDSDQNGLPEHLERLV